MVYFRILLSRPHVDNVLKNLSGELAGSHNKQTIILFNWLLFILQSNVTKLAQFLFYNSLSILSVPVFISTEQPAA